MSVLKDERELEASPESANSNDPGGERFTDMANAKRIATEAAERAVHVAETKDRWHVYDGVKLAEDQRTAMVLFVKSAAQRLYEEAATLTKLLKQREEEPTEKLTTEALRARLEETEKMKARTDLLKRGGDRLESRDGCFAALDLAKAEPALRLRMVNLDAHPLWLNTPTATIDLETGRVWAPRFSDYLTKATRAIYDPTAACPRWLAFLEQVLPDPEVRAFMQRTVGVTLTDVTSEQCLWFLYGLGRNGKSTFINAVRYMLGDYAASTKASTLMVKAHGDDKRNDIAVLRGARFVSVTETEDGQQMAESLIKEITGQDPVTARMMYAEFFTFVPTFKILLAANHKPMIRGQDLAVWRRIMLVPFEQTIPLEAVDKRLPAALEAEASGILNWALEGFRAWYRGGLRPPTAVAAATEEYRLESDVLREFVEDCLIVGPGREARSADVFKAYQRWAEENGVQRPLTQQGLGRLLAARGYQHSRDTRREGRGRGWVGFSVAVRAV
jgi:putative DNA primase/helicase